MNLTFYLKSLFCSIVPKRSRLPDFLIIGAQKCGTTSLYSWIVQHPKITPASKKEVHYFDINYRKGRLWYSSHFLSTKNKAGKNLTGEATPYYLFHPYSPRRIAKLLPNAKLIVLLRNPVDRAISHYYHELTLGFESLSLKDALERENERTAMELEKFQNDENYISFNHQHYTYLERGHYIEQLKHYEEYFRRDQILILKSETLFVNPADTLETVFNFLGVENDSTFKNMTPKNTGNYESHAGHSLYLELKSYFVPYNLKLYEYLEEDFGW